MFNSLKTFLLGRHVCRTKLPPKSLTWHEKRFEKREKKIRKTIRNATEKCLAPLRPLKNISLALFWKFFTAQNLHKKVFFSTRGSAGVATLSFSFLAISRAQDPSKITKNNSERILTPRHKTNTCRKKFLGNSFFREYMRGPLFALSRMQENIFEESFSAY